MTRCESGTARPIAWHEACVSWYEARRALGGARQQQGRDPAACSKTTGSLPVRSVSSDRWNRPRQTASPLECQHLPGDGRVLAGSREPSGSARRHGQHVEREPPSVAAGETVAAHQEARDSGLSAGGLVSGRTPRPARQSLSPGSGWARTASRELCGIQSWPRAQDADVRELRAVAPRSATEAAAPRPRGRARPCETAVDLSARVDTDGVRSRRARSLQIGSLGHLAHPLGELAKAPSVASPRS